jgi:hypothetical protein
LPRNFLEYFFMFELNLGSLLAAGAFFAVLAIAAVIAVGVSWLGYHNAGLWIVVVGLAGGWVLARIVRGACR